MRTLLPLLIGLWSTTAFARLNIDACDANWLHVARFNELLAVELAQHPNLNGGQCHIAVTHCRKDAVTLVVRYAEDVEVSTISLVDTPPENRLRTVVLAAAELLNDIDRSMPPKANAQSENVDLPFEPSPPAARKMPTIPSAPKSTKTRLAKKPKNPARTPAAKQKTTPTKKKKQTERLRDKQVLNEALNEALNESPAQNGLNSASGDMPPSRTPPFQFAAGIDAILFPTQKTAAPKLRLTIRWQRFLLGTVVYGRRWKDPLGSATIVGTGGFTGMKLWETQGSAVFGGDIVTELGAVFCKGSAVENATDSKAVNFSFGGQAQIWLRTGTPKTNLQMTFGVGWLRGLKAWAANRELGGFHGLLLSLGAEIVWQ